MKTSSAKAKGRRAAQLAASLLSEYSGLEIGNFMVTPSGVTGEDIRFSPAANAWIRFKVESKNQEALNIWNALAQSKTHCKDKGDIPLVVFTRNRSEMYVAMEITQFLELICKQKDEKESQ